MSRKTLFSVAGIVLIGVLAFAYMGILGLPINRFADAKAASMRVGDTNGLVVGSRVLVRGVQVGHVTAVKPSAGWVDVSWEYRAGEQIPADNTVKIETLSALGEPVIAITPHTVAGPYLADNAVIEPSRVDDPATFKDLSQRLTGLLKQVDPNQVSSIFTTLDVALPGPCGNQTDCVDGESEVLGSISGAGAKLASMIGGQSDNLTTLLATLQPLLMRSDGLPAALRDAGHVAPGFGVTYSGVEDALEFAVNRGGPLATGIRDGAGPFLVELQKFLDSTAADLKIIGDNLLPAVTAGASALRSIDVGALLDRALRDSANGAVTLHLRFAGR